ncbi:MAG: hypothetical protein OXH64_07075 [Rhodospirillaceae bacterium]|nr:hypothetical protein [Rhodospirillaceae bacterium]
MLHRITGRAKKCGPSTISAIAGVPTHEAAAVIRRLYNRPAVNGVATDELAATLVELGLPPNYALRHPRYPNGRWKESEAEFDRLFAHVPFDVRSVSLGTFLDVAPSGSWAIAAARHWIAYADGFVADSGYWLSRKPQRWTAIRHSHPRVAGRRIIQAIRFVRALPAEAPTPHSMAVTELQS